MPHEILESRIGSSGIQALVGEEPNIHGALQAAFFHNGAFTRLEDAIYHHLHVFESAQKQVDSRFATERDVAVAL